MRTFRILLSGLAFLGLAFNAHAYNPDLDISFVTSSATVDESAGTVTLNVVASSTGSLPSFEASVDFMTTPGTATERLDFVARTGVLLFSDSNLSQSIVIPIVDDSLVEGPEAFTVVLLNPQGSSYESEFTPTTIGDTSEVTIVDNDVFATPDISFESSSAVVDESAGTVTLNVVVSSTGPLPSFEASVDFSTMSGTATERLDFVARTGVLLFSDSNLSQSIVIPIVDDGLVEGPEAFTVVLLNPQGSSGESELTPTTIGDTSEITIVDDDENATLNFVESATIVSEDAGTLLLAVNRSGNAYGPVTVVLTAQDGTALSGADYVPDTTPLVWADQEVGVQFFRITINDDTEDEPDEDFTVTLGDVTGQAELGSNTVVSATITDNDEPGTPVFRNLPQSVNEDVGSATITVGRVGGSSGILEVSFDTSDGSAEAGEDYSSVTDVLTWLDGDTGDQTIPIPIVDDGLVEEDELLQVTLTDLNNLDQLLVGDLTILDNDVNATLSFVESATVVSEDAGTLLLAVSRSGNATGTVSVVLTAQDGTALSGEDYIPDTAPLVWEDQEVGEQFFRITINNDTEDEPDEDFTVTLGDVTGQAELGAITVVTATITDNDEPGTPIFRNLPQSVNEGVGSATITVGRVGGSSGTFTVSYETVDGSATTPEDYTAAIGTLEWADGDTSDRTFSIPIEDDGLVEEDELLQVTLTDPNNPDELLIGDLTIVDNDANALLQFSSSEFEVNESDGTVTLSVTRTGNETGPVSVEYEVRDGTALAGSDYQADGGTLRWGDGDMVAKPITIVVFDDNVIEVAENFTVMLENPEGQADLGPNNPATVTIISEDVASGVALLTETVAVSEGDGVATLTVERTGSTSGEFTVTYETATGSTATANDDFIPVEGEITWADGDDSVRTINVTIVDDGEVEEDELIVVNIYDPSDTTAAARLTALITIVDNDVVATLGFLDLSVTTTEEAEEVTVTVNRSGNSTGPVSVDFMTVDGTAIASEDYTAASGTLTWAAGELGDRTLSVFILDDSRVEEAESFTIELSGLDGQASLGDNRVITIEIDRSDRTVVREKLNPNQRAVAALFDNVCPRLEALDELTAEQRDLVEICHSLTSLETTDGEVCAALDAIMPNELFVSSFNALKLTAIQHGNLSQRINALRNGATGIDLAGLDIEINGETIAGSQIEEFVDNLVGGAAGEGGLNWGRWGAFVDGRLVTGEKDKGELEDGFDFDIYGFTAGIDYRIRQNFIVGGAVGYGVVDSDFQGSGGGMDIESLTAAVFLTYFTDSTFYLDAMATWGRNEYESKRNINFTSSGLDIRRQAVGKTDGDQYSFGLGSGFDFSNGPLTYGPHAGAYYFNVASDSFTERGASGLELVVGDQRSESLTANLGGHISYAVTTDWGVFVPNARVDWVNEFKDNRETLSFNFLHDPFSNDPSNPSPAIKIRTDKPDTNYLIWSVGVSTQLINGIAGFVDYKSFSGYENVSLSEISWGVRWEKTW